MSSSKHPKSKEGETGFQNDLDRNPGIGQSGGSFASGEMPGSIEASNTVEGDVKNDPNAQGGIDEERLGRTNR